MFTQNNNKFNHFGFIHLFHKPSAFAARDKPTSFDHLYTHGLNLNDLATSSNKNTLYQSYFKVSVI